MKSEVKDGRFGKGSFPGEKKTLTVNDVEYTFCWCPPGEFTKGSPKTEKGRGNGEVRCRVQITRGFWLLETPLTQRMWESVMRTTIREEMEMVDLYDGFCGVGPDYPMYYVNWLDSVRFCRILSGLSGEKISLPTEAQWEYACRAGTTTALYTGEIEIIGAYNAPALDPIAWYGGNSSVNYRRGEADEGFDTSKWKEMQYPGSPSGTHEVKGKKPNVWGLYDMLGNVWEWCSNRGDSDYYTNSPEVDPQGPSDGSSRVFRGGSWSSYARGCRSACRNWDYPGCRRYDLGFRPLLSPATD